MSSQNNPSTHSGLPRPLPPQPSQSQPQLQQYPRPTALIHHRSQSPHPPHGLQATAPPPGPYPSPHSTTHSVSQHAQQQQQHHSPYVGSGPAIPQHHPQHHPGETTFFAAHPSPYSSNSAAGSYASSEPGDTMATQAAINRQPYPPISSYQTPQSNSPASIHSPQTDAHGRSLYGGGMASMATQMYYQPQYQMQAHQQQHQQHQQGPHQSQPHQQQAQQHSPYAQNHPSNHHPAITSPPNMLMSHQTVMTPQPSAPSHHQQPHSAGHSQASFDHKPSIGSIQRPPSVSHTPNTPTGPAPGPIPATTPLVVRQDSSGVQWIAFEYSRDRVKMEYQIRCDVESVNIEELSDEFKNNNCVYPRACCNKSEYKGNRLHYETECNAVGWALAELNPNLREKRGLIQRAVDSWRNSNQDPRLRSRRVRRQSKLNSRRSAQHVPHGTPMPNSHGPAHAGFQTPQAGHDYSNTAAHHHQPPSQGQGGAGVLGSDTRYAQSFYPSYPSHPSLSGASMPSIPDGMGLLHGSASTLAAPAATTSSSSRTTRRAEDDEAAKRALFGDVPENKRRKFILVDDHDRKTRVRVRVMLDQVTMDDMPDDHLVKNAVYPRSYYPRQMRSPPGSPPGPPSGQGRWADDEDDVAAVAESGTYVPGTVAVTVPTSDGGEARLDVPRMTKSRRAKEVALNELGHRMSWAQARTFHRRNLFLQRSLDAYRNKMRSTMIAAGQDVTQIAPHFETRPGKRKWLERNKRVRGDGSP